ncbi:MAG TPA: phosphatase PAP2 family protein [Vicinamibacteria bacterium]
MSDTPAPRPSFYRRWLSAEGYLGLHLVIGLFLAVATAVVFEYIEDKVFSTGDIRLADARAQLLARRIVSPRLTAIMQTISMFGTLPALVSLSLAVIAWLLKVKSHRRLYAFVATMAGGALLNGLLKVLYHRARPDSPLVLAHGFSFPSGHSMGAMCFFGSLAYVIYFTIETHPVWRIAAGIACGLAVLAIGASRIYLGVHYFSDVVAGYAAGLFWMAVCFTGVEAWARWRDYRAARRKAAAKAAATNAGVLLLAMLGGTGVEGGEGSRPPCAECVAWEATTEEAEALLASGGGVAGLDVLLTARARPVPGDLLRRLQQKGARPGVLLVSSDAMAGVDAEAFALKTRATELRAQQPEILIGLEAPPLLLADLASRGLGGYVDVVVAPGGAAGGASALGVPVWHRYPGPPTIPALLAATTAAAGERVLAPATDPGVVLAMAGLRDLLPSGLSPLPEVHVACEADNAAADRVPVCTSAVFLHPRTLEAIALVTPQAPVRSVVVTPSPRRVDRTTIEPTDPLAPFVLRIAGWSRTDAERFASEVDVTGERSLSVEEVIARHQAAAARQRERVRSLIASGTTVLTFQIPGLAAPMTISSETVVYQAAGVSEVEQRNIRLNGLAYEIEKGGVPRLPIVEPERVSEPPLAISLTEVYRYKLEGREKRQGRDAYVVSFAPKAEARSLFRGRAWIDSSSFDMLRVEASQTALRGAIVSSQQEDEFVPVPAGGATAWLLGRSETHQVYAGAGHRTPIHRVLALTTHEPNPPGFAARLEAAHASASVMLQETPEGFRYLKRTGKGDESPKKPGEPGPVRVAAGKAQRVRTIAAGVLVDPNIDHPLPFAGLSYLDFDFLRSGAQVNAFFGGAFAQLAFAVPSLGGTRLQLHGAGFATVAEYNDRSFKNGVEIYDEDVRQRPARFALGLLHPLGPRWRARVDYELAYTRYRRAGFADPAFAPPASTPVHGVRVALEAQEGPWSAALWWGAARRQHWPEWGLPGNPEFRAGAIGFQRYGADLARSFVFSPRVVARAELAWMAGRDLDRFSRFSFDGFDNRLRGYPGAGLRYDRGAVLRTAVSWNAWRRLRLDGFLDGAFVRDPGFGPSEKGYAGAGAGLETALPKGLLIAFEWGYGFQARDREGNKGAHVFRATAYKLF